MDPFLSGGARINSLTPFQKPSSGKTKSSQKRDKLKVSKPIFLTITGLNRRFNRLILENSNLNWLNTDHII